MSLRVGLLLVLLPAVARAQENVLLLIADDVGVDVVAAYREHPDPARTPNLDRLAREGELFRQAWANPSCSPTRATLLTGRYGFRTGVGVATAAGGGSAGFGPAPQAGLDPAEVTLPDLLTPAGYATAALGKWHLASSSDGPLHPLECGFATQAGSLFNLPDYFDWEKTVAGTPVQSHVYATTDTTDDALRAARTLPEPWFLWVAYNAAHVPFHEPPAELHTQGSLTNAPAPLKFRAMVEAMDTEIGRLLEGMPPDVLARTHIVFVGDNGTPPAAVEPPLDPSHAKKSLYQGGVRVPLIVWGPAVARPGSECDALVNTTDVFATVADLAGIDPKSVRAAAPIDAVSFVPCLAEPSSPGPREFVYAERFSPNGPGPYAFHDRAVREARYKLIERRPNGESELYDLLRDPFERSALPQDALDPPARAAYDRLRAVLRRLDSEAGTPRVFCSSQVGSGGCSPAIGWTGAASAGGQGPFDVQASSVPCGAVGSLLYGTRGGAATPFGGGLLCVHVPVRLLAPVTAAGSGGPCAGLLVQDFAAWIQSGSDEALVAGAQVDLQWLLRDPGARAGSGWILSDALELFLLP